MLTENKYKPAVFWSWNNVVEADEAARQVADFADKGIGGVFVHARNVRIPYMGEQWFVDLRRKRLAQRLRRGRRQRTRQRLLPETP